MAALEFEYRKYKSNYYPLVTLRVSRLGKETGCEALLDSGSNYSLFQTEIAESLGIPIERGRRISIKTVSGEMPIFIHKITLQLLEKEFECEVGFVRGMGTSLNLLGRIGVFENHEITFKEKEKKLMLNEV